MAAPRSVSVILKNTYKGDEEVHVPVHWGSRENLINVREGDDVPVDRTPLYAFEPDMAHLAKGYNRTVEALLRTPSEPLKGVEMFVSLATYDASAAATPPLVILYHSSRSTTTTARSCSTRNARTSSCSSSSSCSRRATRTRRTDGRRWS